MTEAGQKIKQDILNGCYEGDDARLPGMLDAMIAEAVAAEREAILQALEADRVHSGRPCGCGECSGPLCAIDIIRKRGEE